MKKPSFTDALTQDQVVHAEGEAEGASKAKPKDDRINTTLRISPAGLEALKNIAAAKRVRVNDLLLEGAEHVLAINGRRMQLRR